MKIEYYLLPEADYKGQYDRKEGHFIIKTGTIADMIHCGKSSCERGIFSKIS